MKKNKKKIVIGIIVLLLAVIGLTYAYLIVTRTAAKENEVVFGCIDISLENEANDITLTNQFPISDEEGMNLTPYTFTVKNNCDNDISYYINLEAIGTEADSIRSSSIKIMLDENAPVILGDKFVGQKTIETAYKAHLLKLEELGPKGSADHTLRLWLDKDAPLDEMQKTFTSKITVTTTQPIKQPDFGENTLAAAVINNSGQFGIYPELSSEWKEYVSKKNVSEYFAPSATFWFADDYYFDPYTKTFQLKGETSSYSIANYRKLTSNNKIYTTKNVSSNNSKRESSTLFEVVSSTSETQPDNSTYMYMDVNVISVGTDFAANRNNGLYKMTDDYGESYYLRGNIENNYVQFGTYAKDTTIKRGNSVTKKVLAGTPMYWRVVRINGDGTIRLIYDGTELNANVSGDGVADDIITNIGFSQFNAEEADSRHVGYTYLGDDGKQVDSTVKTFVDDWYETHLKANYEGYIADSIFCNNREGINDDMLYVEIKDRYYDSENPSLLCPNVEDRYTVNSNNGNGYLTNPVGLLTADEAMAAGISVSNYGNTYLRRTGYSWTMTPSIEYAIAAWHFDAYGMMSDWITVSDTSYPSVRPVINLKANVAFTGNGTIDSPYVITMD